MFGFYCECDGKPFEEGANMVFGSLLDLTSFWKPRDHSGGPPGNGGQAGQGNQSREGGVRPQSEQGAMANPGMGLGLSAGDGCFLNQMQGDQECWHANGPEEPFISSDGYLRVWCFFSLSLGRKLTCSSSSVKRGI